MIKNITKECVISAIETSTSAIEASKILGVQYKTFKRYAKIYGVWKPNQSGKGTSRPRKPFISTEDILSGKISYFSTNNLKKRLVKEGILDYKCLICGINEWRGSKLVLELDHIDGNIYNCKADNLRLF